MNRAKHLYWYPNKIYYIDHATSNRSDYFDTKLDTFLPWERKPYFISLLWQKERGSQFYSDVCVSGKVLGKEAHTRGAYGVFDTIFHFLLHVNAPHDKIRRVDSTFEQIIERYEANGWKPEPFPGW